MTEQTTTAPRPGFLKTYIIPLLFVAFHMGAIYAVSRLMMALKPGTDEQYLTLVSILIACAIVSPLTYLFLRWRAKRHPATLLDDKANKDDLIQTVGWSLIGINIARLVIIIFAVLAVSLPFLQPLIERYTGLSEVMAGSEVPLSLLVLATTIVGPLAEELVYRGAVMGAFRAVMSDRWAIVLSALIFGIVHMDVIQGTYAFVLGLILGYLYMKTRNIWCAYLMHMILNFLGGPLTKILGADQDPVKAMVLVLGLFLVGIVGIVMVVVNNGKQKREAYLRQQHDAVSNEHQS